MAWTSDDWKQDSSIFYGYPIPVSAVGVPEIPDISGFNHPWIFDDLFYGYPHHEDSLKPDALDISNFKHPWIFDDLFYGYPHVTTFPLEVEWSDPVTDRTSNDIKNAIKNTNKKKTNPAIDFEYTKAYLNYTDLNRIEGNTAYLANKVSSSGDYKISWTMKDIPLVADRTRILLNMSNVRTAFLTAYPEAEVVQMPIKLSSWSDFNQLETLQFQIYSTLVAESE